MWTRTKYSRTNRPISFLNPSKGQHKQGNILSRHTQLRQTHWRFFFKKHIKKTRMRNQTSNKITHAQNIYFICGPCFLVCACLPLWGDFNDGNDSHKHVHRLTDMDTPGWGGCWLDEGHNIELKEIAKGAFFSHWHKRVLGSWRQKVLLKKRRRSAWAIADMYTAPYESHEQSVTI